MTTYGKYLFEATLSNITSSPLSSKLLMRKPHLSEARPIQNWDATTFWSLVERHRTQSEAGEKVFTLLICAPRFLRERSYQGNTLPMYYGSKRSSLILRHIVQSLFQAAPSQFDDNLECGISPNTLCSGLHCKCPKLCVIKTEYGEEKISFSQLNELSTLLKGCPRS